MASLRNNLKNPKYLKWLENLTEEQMREIVIPNLMDAAVTYGEIIGFTEDDGIPYWRASGDPVVPGQRSFGEEEI